MKVEQYEQYKSIIENAPEGATHYVMPKPMKCDFSYLKERDREFWLYELPYDSWCPFIQWELDVTNIVNLANLVQITELYEEIEKLNTPLTNKGE